MEDRGFFLTLQSIRKQLAAMPNELYLVRLIHHATGRPVPGERLWTAGQLVEPATVRFLRARNREGCDIYVVPYAGCQNSGYVLIDLDCADASGVESMRAHDHHPCVVVQTSPGHLQAWVQLSTCPLEPSVATAASRHLARCYHGDLASCGWSHLGRLAGFTNQKPARRTHTGFAPWVKIVSTHPGLAPGAAALLGSLTASSDPPVPPPDSIGLLSEMALTSEPAAAEAASIYSQCVRQWRIHDRFPHPDWSIVDLWVARHLLLLGTPLHRIEDIVRLASPQFPRRHANPDDYLRRTLARAVASPFPRAARPLCDGDHRAASAAPASNACSNSTGGR